MVERITLAQQHAVNEQRRLGRTDRQTEKIVGLPHGILSRPYLVDSSEEDTRKRGEKAFAEWCEREDAFHRAVFRPQRTFHGWRPEGDCVKDRPDARRRHGTGHKIEKGRI